MKPPLPTTAPENQPFVSIFIPSFNRAHSLPETLESVALLEDRDFEVVLVDDGSRDHTEQLIHDWQARNLFPIQYIRQPNQGKHVAHNTALHHANGFFFITLDSDDLILPDAITHARRAWQKIEMDNRSRCAGIAGLCLTEAGHISGTPYPENVNDISYLEMYQFCKMNGERREFIRTGVLRQFPYPVIKGERHIRPSLILCRLSHHYHFRYTNHPFEINRHAPDGICANRLRYQLRNPRGYYLCFKEEINEHSAFYPARKLRHHYKQYIRFACHSGVGFRRQKKEVRHQILWLALFPAGVFRWLKDSIRKRWILQHKGG